MIEARPSPCTTTGGPLRCAADVEALIDALLGAMCHRLLLEHAPPDECFAERLVDTLLEGVRS